MSNQIPGVPEGWELVKIGTPVFDVDWVIDPNGNARLCDYDSAYLNRAIIRKIEKPAAYRPFANAEEYFPHWGKPVKCRDSLGFDSIISTSELGVYTAQARMVRFFTMEEAFGFLTFSDGTPFGVKIDE
jgi:hypothetical protein